MNWLINMLLDFLPIARHDSSTREWQQSINRSVPFGKSCGRTLALVMLGALLFVPFQAQADPVVGAFPWVTLMCKYADIADEPRTPEFVQEMFGDEPGELNHYWKEVSYGKSSLDGSQVYGWYTLPFPREYYFIGGEPDERQLVSDCASAADNDVNFSEYFGINVFTNGAWTSSSGGSGGELYLNLDGRESHSFTAIGSNAWVNQGFIVHEMGHGFGLRHSNNSDQDSDPYDSGWSIMSSVRGYAVSHPLYGYLAKDFNAYEKEILGWLEPSEVITLDLDTLTIGASQIIDLTALARPQTAPSANRMLKLTRGGSEEDFFFTLEARERIGDYESALPDNGVVIHEVDLRTRRAAWVIDENSPPADFAGADGAVWTVGEIYRGDGFNVEVTGRTGTGFEVAVTATNGSVDGNSVPFIRPFAKNQQVGVGDLFQLYLFPVDPDGFAPDVVAYNLPTDAELEDNGDGVWIFEWRPTIADVGTFDISFEAVDKLESSLRSSRALSLEVIDGSVSTGVPSVSTAPGIPEPLLGNVPWVTLLCKFSDVEDEPATTSFVQEMFGDGIGQINHWWKEVSYNNMNIDGSLVLGWYELPGSRSDYIVGDESSSDIDDERLTRECIAAADNDVDFSRFYGVNTFFNSAFNSHGIGFGIPRDIASDEAGLMATTAISLPAWTVHTAVIHEMSLAVGLPLANNSDQDDNPYDNPWTNMSDGQGYSVPDLRYGYLAKHLNGFEKYSLGWLKSNEVTELRVDTSIPGGLWKRLTSLGSYPDESRDRLIILRDPLLGDSVFYTIEARARTGNYDSNLPGSAVVIHEIDLRRSEPAWSVYDTSDGSTPLTYAYTDNDMWIVGETFLLPGASVLVGRKTDESFDLFIQTGLEREPSNTTIGSGSPPNGGPVDPTDNSDIDTSAYVLGAQPWVTLMCKFADDPIEPETVEFVRDMFGDEVGQLNHYWQAQSYGRMNLNGSKVWGWYVLPGTRADYISDDEVSDSMVDDCISLADPDVDFADFYGVNTFFNGEFNALQSGTGGKLDVDADGAGIVGYTALSAPSWTWQAAIAHEMARGMGLTLTNNSDMDDNSYDNPWTLMSDSRAYANIDPVMNYIAKNINAHDKEKLGWLDATSIYDLNRTYLNNGTTLELHIDSIDVEDADNPRALKFIDVSGGEGAVYYLEARTRGGPYDGSLPTSGILVHEIIADRYEPAWLYHDPALGEPSDYSDSPGDVWTEGEQVILDGVEITVTRKTETGYVIQIYSDKNYIPASSNSGDSGNGGPDEEQNGENGGTDTGTLVDGGSNVNSGVRGGGGLLSFYCLLIMGLVCVKRGIMARRARPVIPVAV